MFTKTTAAQTKEEVAKEIVQIADIKCGSEPSISLKKTMNPLLAMPLNKAVCHQVRFPRETCRTTNQSRAMVMV
jgi:hypothetical protein